MRECVRENHFACRVCVCVCVCVFPVLLSCDNAILSCSVVYFMHVFFAARSAWLCVRSNCWFSVKQLASFFGRNACKYRYTNSCFVFNNFLFHGYSYDKMDRVFWSLRKANNNLQLKKRGCSGSKEKHICKNIFALWWSQFVLVDQNCFGNCQRFLG
jgi:hypothetical protein